MIPVKRSKYSIFFVIFNWGYGALKVDKFIVFKINGNLVLHFFNQSAV